MATFGSAMMLSIMPEQIVGIDVGGANLKYASNEGRTLNRCFPLWRRPAELGAQIASDLRCFNRIDSLAVTMTGELADCFLDRAEGVDQIVRAVESAGAAVGVSRIFYYAINLGFVAAGETEPNVDRIAASNWHALASFVGRHIAADTLLVDIGSTTTDIVRLVNGRVATQALTDYERLACSSLVYIGCERTPVCSLVDTLAFRGQKVSVMNELFATMDDARLVLAMVSEDNEDHNTADGRPRTVEFARGRLARMIGLDRRCFPIEEARLVAGQIMKAAKQRIQTALAATEPAGNTVVVSGHGHELLPTLTFANVIHLSQVLGHDLSRAAPAYAVSQLIGDISLTQGAVTCDAS